MRKRKITIDYNSTSTELTYKSFADLAEDNEGTYCSLPANCDLSKTTPQNIALTTKTWQFYDPGLNVGLFECDTNPNTGTPLIPTNTLSIELQ